jgi:hypothetical protein
MSDMPGIVGAVTEGIGVGPGAAGSLPESRDVVSPKVILIKTAVVNTGTTTARTTNHATATNDPGSNGERRLLCLLLILCRLGLFIPSRTKNPEIPPNLPQIYRFREIPPYAHRATHSSERAFLCKGAIFQ